MTQTAKTISTRQTYSLDLQGKDVMAFSYRSGVGNDDTATFVVPVHKFPDLDPENEPQIKVTFASGQQMEFDVEDAEISYDYDQTALVISAKPSSYRPLETTLNKMLIYVHLTKEENEEWQKQCQGLDADMSFLNGLEKADVDYILRVKLKEKEKPWTTHEILKDLCDVYDVSCAITAPEVEFLFPFSHDWRVNLWSAAKDLFRDTAVMRYDLLSDTLYVSGMFDVPVKNLYLQSKPGCTIERGHPVITEDAMYELLGGEVELRPDKWKWGNIFTTQLDPSDADLPIQSNYLKKLLSGEDIPQDFFTLGDAGVVAKEGKDNVLNDLDKSVQDRITVAHSDYCIGKGFDPDPNKRGDGIFGDRDFQLASRDSYKDRLAWNASKPYYYHKLEKKVRPPVYKRAGLTKEVFTEWIGYSAIGEPMVKVFEQMKVFWKDDPAEPLDESKGFQEGWKLMELRETLHFYEGIDVKCKKPRVKCSVTVIGRALVELRPSEFKEGDDYHKWADTHGTEFGSRAPYFNATAAGKAGKAANGQIAPWVTKWVWEPNAGFIIESRAFDERGYIQYIAKQVFGITYEDTGKLGNEKIDQLNAEPGETTPSLGQGENEDGSFGGNPAIGSDITGPGGWTTGGFGNPLSPGFDPSRPGETSTMFHHPFGNESKKSDTLGQVNADAVNQNTTGRPKLKELSEVMTKDKYQDDATYHWMIFTTGRYGSWTQDPACLVSSTITMFQVVSISEVRIVTYNTRLINGHYKQWPDVNEQPYNVQRQELVETIKHPCYYDQNWPELDDRLVAQDMGLQEQASYIDTWAEIEAAGERKWEQAKTAQHGYAMDFQGSLLIPMYTKIRFSTPRRRILQGGAIHYLQEVAYEALLTTMSVEKTPESMARIGLGARDILEE